jgi:hypothetical protein
MESIYRLGTGFGVPYIYSVVSTNWAEVGVATNAATCHESICRLQLPKIWDRYYHNYHLQLKFEARFVSIGPLRRRGIVRSVVP